MVAGIDQGVAERDDLVALRDTSILKSPKMPPRSAKAAEDRDIIADVRDPKRVESQDSPCMEARTRPGCKMPSRRRFATSDSDDAPMFSRQRMSVTT